VKLMPKTITFLFALPLLCCLVMLSPTKATAQTDITAKFVDANFLKEVRKAINKPAGPIYNTDVVGVTELYVGDRGIANLAGIEYFTNLKTLYCLKNRLAAIDVSKNKKLNYLWFTNNQLTEIDLSKNFNLESLGCSNNRLTSLNVSKKLYLKDVICSNNQLTSLNLSGVSLNRLDCSYNKLTVLGISKGVLRELNFSNNQITSIDVPSSNF